MNRTLKFIAVSALASGLLLAATPALADSGDHDRSGDNGWHLDSILNLPFMHIGVVAGNFKKSDEQGTSTASGSVTGSVTSVTKNQATIEIGTVGSVNGSNVTLDPAINLRSGTSAAPTNVVVTSSTKFKGASSTASLTSGENVVIVGTTSTSTPNTITASIVIVLKNAWHFCTHLFSR